MGTKAPAAPAAPDPVKTAAAQTQGDVQSAIANAIIGNANQISPTGSISYQQTGTQQIKDASGNSIDVPQYTSTTTLSPEQQQLYNQQTQLGSGLNNLAIDQVGNLSNTLGKPLDTSGINPLQTSYSTTAAPTTFGQTAGQIQYGVGPTDFTNDRNAVTDATMAQFKPQLNIQQNTLDAKLANQGIAVGSQAWNDAQAAQGQVYNNATSQAVLAGATEQNQLFGQALQQGQFNNAAQNQDFGEQQARGAFAQQGVNQNNVNAANQATFGNQASGQQLQQLLAERNQPINEISSLMSGGQVSMPQFSGYNAPTVANSSIGADTYNSAAIDEQNYAQQTAQANAAMGGLFSLGSSAILGGLGGAGGFSGLFGLAKKAA